MCACRTAGFIDKDLGEANHILGLSLHTRAGRGEHWQEHVYRVLDAKSGAATIHLRR